jgi:hypothetical protein
MRVFLSGLVGAAVSAAAWFSTEYASHHELGFLAIAVGLVTGLCVNAAAGKAAPQSFGRAILAVVLTLVAIVGGRWGYAEIMQRLFQVTSIAAVDQGPEVEVEEETALAGGTGEVVEVVEEVPPRSSGPAGTKMGKPPATVDSALDLAWMGIAALVAYITGKGAGHPVVAPAKTESSEAPSA